MSLFGTILKGKIVGIICLIDSHTSVGFCATGPGPPQDYISGPQGCADCTAIMRARSITLGSLL